MKIRPILFITLMLSAVIFTSLAYAEGETGANFLLIGVGGRPEGMGGAYTAIANDANAVNINPAGMSDVKGREVTVMHNEYLLDLNHEYLAYVDNNGKRAWGASLVYLDFGTLEYYTASNTYVGTFTPNSWALTAAYSRKSGNDVSWGVSLKYIREKIAEFKGDAIAVDGGVIYAPKDMPWRVGASLQNIGTKMDIGTTKDPLPLTLRVGGAYKFTEYPLLVSSDVLFIRDSDTEFHLGLEYKFAEIAALRAGYNSDDDLDNGFTFGLGLEQPEYKIDYAFVPMGVFGDSHRFSLSLMF